MALSLSGEADAPADNVSASLFRNCPGMEIASTEGKRQRKRFFFEKKNQKTFTNSG
jgi:hypothetical protein